MITGFAGNAPLGSYRVDTYGCQMNAHESEKIAGMLDGLGLSLAGEEETPDILVLNTCCVRDSAEQRIIGHIGTLKKAKEEKPHMLLCVVGCMSQQKGMAERLTKTFPFVDVILGTHSLPDLADAISECIKTGHRVIRTSEEASHAPDDGSVKRTPGPLAYVNIMYGCNNFCSYCIVPYVRGRERSRHADAIIDEVQSLVKNGYCDVTLLGQNVNSYRSADGMDFPALLRRIAHETDIPRIRFMTSHPKDLSDDLIEVVATEKTICNHVHLPVQSGSNAVLKSMNRGYTREHYMHLVDSLRKSIPDISLTTDLIVGYPGESEQDFLDTLDLVKSVRFDSAYTFVYSKRRGTKAADLPNQIPAEIKKDRIMRLIDEQNAITREIGASSLDKIFEILVEGKSARNNSTYAGRTEGARMVNFPSDIDLTGRFVNVVITEVKANTLYGKQAPQESHGIHSALDEVISQAH